MNRYLNAKVVRKILKTQGRSQTWIAAQVGVKRNTFSRYLAGDIRTSEPVLKLIAQTLETTEDHISKTAAKRSKTRR